MLSYLGPDAMVANLGPRLEGQASAIASLPSQGKIILSRAADEQLSRSGSRMSDDLDAAFGPAESHYTQRTGYRATQKGASLLDQAAKGRTVDTSDLPSTLMQTVDEFPQTGSARAALDKINQMMIDPRTGRFIDDAGNLVGVRHELDALIEDAGGKGYGAYERGIKTPVGAALLRVRKSIDRTLKADPVLKQADQIYSTEARKMAAQTSAPTR